MTNLERYIPAENMEELRRAYIDWVVANYKEVNNATFIEFLLSEGDEWEVMLR